MLAVAGGKERIAAYVRDYGARLPPGSDPQASIERIHELKRKCFGALAAAIPLRAGIARLILEAKENGLRVAVVTTAAPEGVEALLHGHPQVRDAIDLIAAGDIVEKKKPAPDIYLYALATLGLKSAEVIAIEDSEIGLRAATAAGVRTLVTRSSYTLNENFASAAAILDDLGEPDAPARVVRGPAPPAGFVDLRYLRSLLD